MTRGAVVAAAAVLFGGYGCGDDPQGEGFVVGPVVFGCPTYPEPTASPGDDLGGDDYVTFAAPLFATYCTRCHNSALTTREERNFAPEGFNWNVEASVRENVARIRGAIGEANFMPPSEPFPRCDERLRLVMWIDAGAP